MDVATERVEGKTVGSCLLADSEGKCAYIQYRYAGSRFRAQISLGFCPAFGLILSLVKAVIRNSSRLPNSFK